MGGIVSLINLIRREVSRVDVGCKFGLEGGTNTAKSVEFDSTEELVVFDLISTSTAQADLGVTDQTKYTG